jgi:hypothetical protein
MHVITVAFGTAPAMWQFVFKTKETAVSAWDSLNIGKAGDRIVIIDDFGQSALFNPADITGRMFEDLDLSKQANIARNLHQQRMQAEFQKAAESDPIIRMAMRGPAVLSPVPGFNGSRN